MKEQETDHTILMVISSKLDNVIEGMNEMKDSLKTKVEKADFIDLRKDVDELKKSKWFFLGIATTMSYIINHFIK